MASRWRSEYASREPLLPTSNSRPSPREVGVQALLGGDIADHRADPRLRIRLVECDAPEQDVVLDRQCGAEPVGLEELADVVASGVTPC